MACVKRSNIFWCFVLPYEVYPPYFPLLIFLYGGHLPLFIARDLQWEPFILLKSYPRSYLLFVPPPRYAVKDRAFTLVFRIGTTFCTFVFIIIYYLKGKLERTCAHDSLW